MICAPGMRALPTRLLCITLALSGLGATASAQGVLPDSGARVRVFFNEGRDYFVGWMLAPSADSLFIEGKAGDTLAVARSKVALLQVSARGSRAPNVLIGTETGLVIGGVMGLPLGSVVMPGEGMVPLSPAPSSWAESGASQEESPATAPAGAGGTSPSRRASVRAARHSASHSDWACIALSACHWAP